MTLQERLRGNKFKRNGDWYGRKGDGSEFRYLDVAPELEREWLVSNDVRIMELRHEAANVIDTMQATQVALFKVVEAARKVVADIYGEDDPDFYSAKDRLEKAILVYDAIEKVVFNPLEHEQTK